MIHYELFTAQRNDHELGAYETCGVAVLLDGKTITVIEDVSPDREKLAALVKRFNEEQLSPIHLAEAIENFLYDFEG